MTTTGLAPNERDFLMGLLDKLLGVSSRKPKRVTTDPAALLRIEETQRELAARLDTLDERVGNVERLIGPPPPPINKG